MSSIAQQITKLDLSDITDEQAAVLLYDWDVWARDKQKEPPGDWRLWLILAGRGFGKTRTGAELVRAQVEQGKAGRIALVGRTTADVRDVMVCGESGILSVCPPWNKPHYESSKRRLTWPNGAIATTYSAEEPDMLRGPQHDFFYCDEIAAWDRGEEAWDQLQFGLRLGKNPRGVATTTPRPTKLMKQLMKASTTFLTRGTTYENKANLPSSFFDQIISKYENTRTGRQELMAELLEDVEGALWKLAMIEECRLEGDIPDLKRIVVAIDPAVTANEGSDETGIIVAGVDDDDYGYVLADRSLRGSPLEWATVAVNAYDEFEADCIVGEVNNGGDLIETVLRSVDSSVSYTAVRASRGKQLRAEPVVSLYERHLVFHAEPFPLLEDQQTTWEPGNPSPDRLDALVWALTELMITNATTADEHILALKRRVELMKVRSAR